MAKRFMYVCLGILALVVAFHLGARYAEATFVDHTANGIIAVSTDMMAMLENGEVWQYSDTEGWRRPTCKGFLKEWPLPPSEIKFWFGNYFYDTSDNFWHWEGCSDTGEPYWENRGSPPGAASTEPSTWGKIKGKFK